MTEQPMFTPEDMDRHRCSYGCGRPFQFAVTNIDDGTTEHLCLPDFVGLSASIMSAAIESGIIDTSSMTVPGTADPSVGYEGDKVDDILSHVSRMANADDGLDSADAYYTEEV